MPRSESMSDARPTSTPTPWRLSKSDKRCIVSGENDSFWGGTLVAQALGADREFIVRAVNSHAALLAHLRNALDLLRAYGMTPEDRTLEADARAFLAELEASR